MTTQQLSDIELPWEEQSSAAQPVVNSASAALPAAPDGPSFDPLYLQTAELSNLRSAWQRIRGKGKGGGIDGETIHSFEQHAEQELAALREELLGGRFVPQPYKQVNIPKKDGDIRSLGLMTRRVNKSVFECFLSDTELKKLKTKLEQKVKKGSDSILCYPLCVDCIDKIERYGCPAPVLEMVKIL